MKDAKGHGSDSRGGPSAEQKTINQSRGRRGVAPGYAGRDVQGRTYPQAMNDHDRFPKQNPTMPNAEDYKTKPAMPIPGHDYHSKTNDELQFIQRDASAAAKNMQGMGNDKAEGKYLDQVNDASTVLGYRQRGGTDLSKGPAAAVGAAHGISGPATYGPGHPSYVAPLSSDLVELLRGREFDKFNKK